MTPKILTVDDSKTIRLIVAKAFKEYDCEIFEAANGVEGLVAAAKDHPDLIILDLTMPLMDGAEMLGKMKNNPDLKSIPVIMLTAEAGRENVLRIAKLGVRDYLIKPFKEEMLVDRVGRVVQLKRRGGESITKRFDDALKILLVDDKPAIVEQIRQALADTAWKLQSCGTFAQAIEFCNATVPDAVLVSLSLPDGGGFSLFQAIRTNARVKMIPVFALSVKTAVEEQGRAQQAGFTGIITKPIDPADVKAKIARALSLDTSYKYFEMRDGAVVVKIPASVTAPVAIEVAAHMRAKILDAVDSGYDKVIVDMSQVTRADVSVIKLGLNATQLCAELSLKQRMIGSEAVWLECKNYQESKDWQFENTFEEALAALNGSALVPAAA
jgi:two-component system, cell cycle response regulator